MLPRLRTLYRQQSGPSEVSLVVKYILFALNTLFWLLGIVMIIVGVYATTAKRYGGIGSTLPWFMDPANLFIIVGSVLFILPFIGCLGSLRENITLLKIFEYSINVLFLVEISLVIYVSVDSGRVKTKVEKILQKCIPRYRDDVDLQTIIDWTQENMKCCGVKDYTDWDKNVYFKCALTHIQNPERCGVPFSCCMDYKIEGNTQCGYDIRDPENDDRRNGVIYTDGCVDSVIKYLLNENSFLPLLSFFITVVVLQLTASGLAHNMIHGIKRQKIKWTRQNTNFAVMETPP